MKPFKVIKIPATNSNEPNRFLGTPGKIHVVGYAQVIKGTGAGLQIRKNIRRIIADRPDWELNYVSTDYCQTETIVKTEATETTEMTETTWRTFLGLLHKIKIRCFDVLIIHSANDFKNSINDLKTAVNLATWILGYCKKYGVQLFIAHNDVLLSEDDINL
jgi:hypothetical protein